MHVASLRRLRRLTDMATSICIIIAVTCLARTMPALKKPTCARGHKVGVRWV